jgi:antitoxin component YwqK of YwqJK toxin-antitoxin module
MIITSSFSQRIVYSKDFVISQNKDSVFYKGAPFSGVLFFENNGKTIEEVTCKNGVKDGMWRKYYETGILYQEANYNEGKQELLKKFDKSGKLQEESLKDGIHSWRKTYYETGILYKEDIWENGQNELSKEYYKSGKLFMEETWKNGKQEWRKTYYETGKLMKEIIYKNNQVEFIRNYNEDGSLKVGN